MVKPSKKSATPKPTKSGRPPRRTIVAQTFLSLDGVMQAPGAQDEDRAGNFRLGGWSMSYWDDTMGKVMGAQMADMETLLLGRKTYDIFAGYWPKHREEMGAAPLNNARKYVASRTRKKLAWENSELLKGDVVTAVANLKQAPGKPIQVLGSSNLLQTLLKHDLVDRLDVWSFPVVLGSGKRLFGSGAIPGAWKLTESQVSTTGVTIHRYERAGEMKIVPRLVT
jgi:dihydrofolate reductase